MTSSQDISMISLVIITLDEADNIERCIRSARGVGEVIVVDSYSTDGTVDIAEKLGAKVYRREFTSHADQKNWALEKAELDWILVLDADESLSGELRDEIGEAIVSTDMDGYWLRRRNEFFGKRIRFCGWNRDRVLRLFRRGKGSYPERAVHERLSLEGRAGRLEAPLDHRPYRDIDDYIERMTRYGKGGAKELRRRGRHWFPGIVLNPPARFVRMYILQLGFLDGIPGLILCTLASISVFFKYMILREISAGRGKIEYE